MYKRQPFSTVAPSALPRSALAALGVSHVAVAAQLVPARGLSPRQLGLMHKARSAARPIAPELSRLIAQGKHRQAQRMGDEHERGTSGARGARGFAGASASAPLVLLARTRSLLRGLAEDGARARAEGGVDGVPALGSVRALQPLPASVLGAQRGLQLFDAPPAARAVEREARAPAQRVHGGCASDARGAAGEASDDGGSAIIAPQHGAQAREDDGSERGLTAHGHAQRAELRTSLLPAADEPGVLALPSGARAAHAALQSAGSPVASPDGKRA